MIELVNEKEVFKSIVEDIQKDVVPGIVKNLADVLPVNMGNAMLTVGNSERGGFPRDRSGSLKRNLKAVADDRTLTVGSVFYYGYVDKAFEGDDFKGSGWAGREWTIPIMYKSLNEVIASI